MKDEELEAANRVSRYMLDLYLIDQARYDEATADEMPYGDLAYGKALADWEANGRPADAWFSYALTEKPCPLLMAFRQEISDHFGLLIMTQADGEQRRNACKNIKTIKVTDWKLTN